ncbi:MAG: PPC domain-containing protein [Gemmataceae bacterium]
MPRGGQRGTEITIAFNGARLADAQEIICYSPGFAFGKLDAKDNVVLAKVKIAPECVLGEHAFRVRTASGLSELKTFWVGALPIVDEKEPNSDFASPQQIPLNVTVHGTVTSEDVDYYVVEAKKGQRISAEIEGLRAATDGGVGNMFDPFLAILDAKRFELATSDDTPLLGQDGFVSVIAPSDGRYIVMVRESAYRGDAGSHYRLHVGTFPRPSAVQPMGGRPGQEVEFTFLGDPTGPIKRTIKLPAQPDLRFPLFADDGKGISPSPLWIRVIDLPNVMEAEPNDDPAKIAAKVEGPCALNGVIEKAGDVDHFRIAAKKGQVFDIRAFARQLGSPLDPVLWVANDKNVTLASNDDSGGPDSYLRFAIPADGDYFIGIRDHLNKGGPTYAYRIEIAPPQPNVTVAVPLFSLYSQERQMIPVPRGNRYATLLTVSRADIGGDVAIDAAGLPAKLAATSPDVPAFMSATPVVLEAKADAPLGGSLTEFRARPVDPKQPFATRFTLRSELVFGPPNLSVFWSYTAPRVPVAVTEAVPFSVTIVEPRVPLAQTGSMNLKVVVERRDGFKSPVTIYPVYNPPGVGSAGAATVAEGQTETVLPINANGGAPPRPWKYVVWGVATVGNGPIWVSSQLATVEITPPMVSLKLDRATGEQGATATIKGQWQTTTPYPGTAKVKLIGLPPKVTAPDLDLPADAKEFAFPLAIDKTAPAGSHKNIYCQVVIVKNGEPIIHNLGSTDLRIDAPLAAKKN